jgi:YVTN family beta-propeller protein
MDALQADDPTRLGPFRIEARIGAGGMGEVYLGRGPDDQVAAVKVIHPGLAADPQFRARFAREIDTARRVHAPWTAPVLDADPHARRPWLATEYVPGPALEQVVSADGPLPEQAVLVLGGCLAEALAALHATGVVHRDLKPSNVLLASDGPRLIDFGIARAVDSTAITHTGHVIGTPAYMSPEQARGEEPGGPSDVFSLAAVLTYAATGSGPYGHSSNPLAMLLRITGGEPDLSRLPTDLRAVLVPCLAKEPADRPSAAELTAQLRRSAPGADPPAAPPPAPTLLDRAAVPRTSDGSGRPRRPRWPAGVGAGVALVLVVALLVLLLRPDGTTSLAAPLPPPATAPPPARQVGSLPVGALPDDVVVAPDGATAYVVGNSALSVIDTATGTVTDTVATPSRPRGVAVSPDGRRVYVALVSGSVSVLDRSTSAQVATIPVGERPQAISLTPDGRAIYVVDGSAGDGISVIDTARDAVVARLPVPPASGVFAAPDSRTVWVHHQDSAAFSVIDTGTNTVTATVPARSTDATSVAVAPDGSRAYTSGGLGTHAISVFDLPGRTKLGEIRDVEGVVADVAVAPDGRYLYVALTGTGTPNAVRVFDTTTSFAVQDIGLDAPPSGLGLAPDGRTLYVASFETNATLVLDTSPYA